MGDGPLEQPLVYKVYYNGTRENVTSSTTTLTFTAPSLPDGVFVDNITVIVTAINRFGSGALSIPDYAEISELCAFMIRFFEEPPTLITSFYPKLRTYVRN